MTIIPDPFSVFLAVQPPDFRRSTTPKVTIGDHGIHSSALIYAVPGGFHDRCQGDVPNAVVLDVVEFVQARNHMAPEDFEKYGPYIIPTDRRIGGDEAGQTPEQTIIVDAGPDHYARSQQLPKIGIQELGSPYPGGFAAVLSSSGLRPCRPGSVCRR